MRMRVHLSAGRVRQSSLIDASRGKEMMASAQSHDYMCIDEITRLVNCKVILGLPRSDPRRSDHTFDNMCQCAIMRLPCKPMLFERIDRHRCERRLTGPVRGGSWVGALAIGE